MGHWWFLGAGALSAVWLLVHAFAGGRDTVRPLLEGGGLPPVVRDTLYVCWHFTSVALAMMAGLFLRAGLAGDVTAAVAATILAGAFALVGIALVLRQGASHLQVPQGWLFVPVAVLGAVGLMQ
ncbi:hypothetical protein [Histidinibacterium lentulum]|uniref:DUF423 domain-containing protein n=1 Tax=Histidinibacterium lentulum TaxID=2480588 RepID=A0A3N2QRV8_9RHOB|nr:hypothetical protein [Histidinibacterium lentulum]ROT97745.1 hypothetical protein EAT49_18240 [Histidinibacterium lentulum]